MPVQPTPGSLYISRPLTNVSVAYQQRQPYIASQVFPIVPVQQQGALYWKYNKGDWFRGQAGLRAPATESTGGGWNVDTSTYFCHVYAVHKDLDDQTRANAVQGGFSLDRDATEWVTQNLLQKRDELFVDTYLKTGVWGTDITGVSSSPSTGQTLQWSNDSSDPVDDVTKAIIAVAQNTGFRPNVMVVGPSVMQALVNSEAILDRTKYTDGSSITEAMLSRLFGVDRFVVTWTIGNDAPEGATDSFSFLSDKTALLVYAPPAPSLQQPSGGYIMSWAGFLGANNSFGTRVRSFRMENVQSDRIEGEMAFDMKLVSSDVGVFFDSIVS